MSFSNQNLPSRSGVGLKSKHYREILETRPDIGWFEVHPENYMGDGGAPHHYLEQIRSSYPLSMHGVGMSLASADGLQDAHLASLKNVVDRYQPESVSEHLAWSHFNQIFHNDLFPIMYTEETLDAVCDNVDRVQTSLQRPILIENPSSYIAFSDDQYSEPEFLNAIAKRTGCGLLLDINNVYVSAKNSDLDPIDFLAAINSNAVGEIHLAGHSVQEIDGIEVRVDDHGSRVIDDVWALYGKFVQSTEAPIPTLIEWDTDVPELDVLMDEAEKAETILRNSGVNDHGNAAVRESGRSMSITQ